MRFALFGVFLAACSGPPAVLVLSPVSEVAFGTIEVGQVGTSRVTVTNTTQSIATKLVDTSTTLGVFSYTGGSYPGTGGTCTDTVAASGSCTLSLSFAPTATATQTDTLTLAYFDGGAVQTLTLQLAGNGYVAPPPKTSSFDPTVYQPSDAAVGQTVEALGTKTTLAGGSTPKFTVTKAANDLGIMIIALSSAADDYLLIDRVTNPNHKVVSSADFFDSAGNYTAQELNRAFPSQGAQAMLIPQSPDFPADTGPGVYSFVITSFDTNSNGIAGVVADVYVVHEKAVATEPSINVNFFLSGSAGLSAATAPTDPAFQAIVAQFVADWGETNATVIGNTHAPCNAGATPPSLGLCIDTIRYVDLPDGYADASGDFEEDAKPKKDLVEEFEQSAGHPAAVNFFILDDISIDGIDSSSGLLGADGNIPSPGAFMGTPRSGAAVILDTLPDVSDTATIARIGATIAHEGGHYLGLYHVQESDCAPDNIHDTPCFKGCTKQPTDKSQADASSCTASDDDTNQAIMYWAAQDGVTQTTFSAGQVSTVRLHPLVH